MIKNIYIYILVFGFQFIQYWIMTSAIRALILFFFLHIHVSKIQKKKRKKKDGDFCARVLFGVIPSICHPKWVHHLSMAVWRSIANMYLFPGSYFYHAMRIYFSDIILLGINWVTYLILYITLKHNYPIQVNNNIYEQIA